MAALHRRAPFASPFGTTGLLVVAVVALLAATGGLAASGRALKGNNYCMEYCQLFDNGANGWCFNQGNQELPKCNLGGCKAALCSGVSGSNTPQCNAFCKVLVDYYCNPGDASFKFICSPGACQQQLGCNGP